jgi:hypothetical protein
MLRCEFQKIYEFGKQRKAPRSLYWNRRSSDRLGRTLAVFNLSPFSYLVLMPEQLAEFLAITVLFPYINTPGVVRCITSAMFCRLSPPTRSTISYLLNRHVPWYDFEFANYPYVDLLSSTESIFFEIEGNRSTMPSFNATLFTILKDSDRRILGAT